MDFDHQGQRAPTPGAAATDHATMPGKRTLTESLVVQRREAAFALHAQLAESGTAASAPAPLPVSASSGPRPALQMLFGVPRAASAAPVDDPAHVHAAAARGTATPASTLPYADQIQRAFGRHDISGIQAHVGSDAAASAREMGAQAYATGDHVVLGEGVGLHTVAHEAAHVFQQRGGVQLKGGVGEVGDAHERHADAVADRVVAGESVEEMLERSIAGAVRNGLAIQRKTDGAAPTDYKGKFLGQKVGETRDEIVSMLTTTLKQPIKASRTLGAYETEAAAIAVVKTNGKPGAVTVEGGKFVAYETDLGFTWRDNYIASMSDMGGGTQFHPPVLAPGVIALISNELVTVRAGQFDPGSKTDQQGSSDAALKAIDNPVAGYRQALGDDKGDLNGLADDKLIAAFNGALKDTAIVVLNKSSDEVKTKQARFTQGSGGVSDTEYDTMKQTAAAIAALDPQISAAQQKLDGLNLSRAMTYGPAGGGPVNTMYDKDIEAARKNLESLQTQRKIQIAKYPLLSRVDNAKFKDKSKDEMAKELGGELPGILKDIETTKQNVADGAINLWGIDQIVDATIASFGLNEAKRKVILDTKASEAKKKTVETVVFTVFAIGFGIAAMFATGGAALFFAAGAFGLSTFDAMKQTEQYMVDKPASNVAEDKDGGFAAPPGWGWLVVAWIGVGLDSAQVVSAVGKVAKTGKVIEGAEELAKAENAAKLGLTRDGLLAKLRQVAGDVDGAAKITEGSRVTVAQRLGIAVDIDPKLAGDVRIYYEVDKTTGRAIVKGLSAGPEATLAEVLAHENVVKLMRRYEGVTGKLREIWEKLLAVVGKSPSAKNPFQEGSKAWESWNELQKMPELVEATKLKYANGVGKANESALAHDLEVLEEEARRHEKIVAEMVDEVGAGFVAKTGDSTKAAVAAKYPLPPGCNTAEEMLAKGYYYRKSADGTYEIVRKSESIGQQLRVEFDGAKNPLRLVPAVEKLEAKIPDAAQLARLRAVVTDDKTLTKLYDAIGDANKLEQVLKEVGDVAKVQEIIKDLGGPTVARLVGEMGPSTLHEATLGDAIAKLGKDKFVALVQAHGVDAMVKYGPEALDKVGFATLDKASKVSKANITPEKLQKKWKHAPALGITDSYKATDKAAHAKYIDAVNDIVSKPDKVLIGPYHDEAWAVHFFQGDKLVITTADGEFISAWDKIASKLGGIEGSAPPLGAKNFRVK